jgi:RNA-directed DNA polymerase
LAINSIHSKNDLAQALGSNGRALDRLLNRLEDFYRPKKIPKKDGTLRTLLIPRPRLKEIQKRIKTVILSTIDWPASVQGGVRGRSVRTSASKHVCKELVITMDVKDFFPSVTPTRVNAIFAQLGMPPEVCGILTKLTTWHGQLPQGVPTSMDLANLALAQVDARISGLCRQQGFAYTRYVDDITVSGAAKLIGFKNLLARIIEEEGFRVKHEKTEVMPRNKRQLVTKVIVNEKLNLPREKRQQIRLEAVRANSSELSRSLKGRINWLGYLNPEGADSIFNVLRAARRVAQRNCTKSCALEGAGNPDLGKVKTSRI